ncbi:hypothetical protein ACFLRZ_01530 [Bacteroidota bacterium]
MTKKLLVILLLVVIVFSTCKKESTLAPEYMGYNYFPLSIGYWIAYQVDSTAYVCQNSDVDTFNFNYQVKELIESSYEDISGRTNYRIERYSRASDSSDWEIRDVWTANIDKFKAIKSEENVQFIKLTFPVKDENKWDGNAFNILEVQEYRYVNVNVSKEINGFNFDSTSTVIQIDRSTLISDDYSEEIFAANIGMVYKRTMQLEKELDQTIKNGIDYTYRIIGYGNN